MNRNSNWKPRVLSPFPRFRPNAFGVFRFLWVPETRLSGENRKVTKNFQIENTPLTELWSTFLQVSQNGPRNILGINSTWGIFSSYWVVPHPQLYFGLLFGKCSKLSVVAFLDQISHRDHFLSFLTPFNIVQFLTAMPSSAGYTSQRRLARETTTPITPSVQEFSSQYPTPSLVFLPIARPRTRLFHCFLWRPRAKRVKL